MDYDEIDGFVDFFREIGEDCCFVSKHWCEFGNVFGISGKVTIDEVVN